MIQPSKYTLIFTLFAVLILTNNNLRGCCYRAKRHCWGGESCGLAKQGVRTSILVFALGESFALSLVKMCRRHSGE